jgi:hypothetical protein
MVHPKPVVSALRRDLLSINLRASLQACARLKFLPSNPFNLRVERNLYIVFNIILTFKAKIGNYKSGVIPNEV